MSFGEIQGIIADSRHVFGGDEGADLFMVAGHFFENESHLFIAQSVPF